MTFKGPFIQRLKKSCRTENSICFVGGLQEHCDLTYVDSWKNKGLPYQEVGNN